jgi:precorrin-3B methylase
MGYNTTVVILNDSLGEIATDPGFGKRLADAIAGVRRGQPAAVAAHGSHGIHCNAALVVETHHADYDVTVRVGGNRGEVVP